MWTDIATGVLCGAAGVVVVLLVVLRVFVLQRADIRSIRRRIVIRSEEGSAISSRAPGHFNGANEAPYETAAWLESMLKAVCAMAARSERVRSAIERLAVDADAALSATVASGLSGMCLRPIRVSEVDIDADLAAPRIARVQASPSGAEALLEWGGKTDGHILAVTVETGMCIGNPATPAAVLPCSFRIVLHSLQSSVAFKCAASTAEDAPAGQYIRRRRAAPSEDALPNPHSAARAQYGQVVAIVRRDGFEMELEVRSTIGARAQLRDAARIANVMHAAVRSAIVSRLEPVGHVIFAL